MPVLGALSPTHRDSPGDLAVTIPPVDLAGTGRSR